ncbi:MAG: DUF86 domain-containing protein [Jaaginema sp. PMC 1079.18]|nr:DUF86 domain-containing protein [Jaaginema sp. PMC 1080.18]MEC4851962.1 DUF86 domain-containing protein [Jaaginema sp. PMC 1079.18]MEC4868472.1 DUF86 domain-containing protein [Jaaginema sp. PMC 1078.18]
MKSRDRASLLDIAQAGELVLEFVAGMDDAEFSRDRKTQSAVLYQIAILGEAVKRLSPEFRQQYPDIPWTAMAGMRDKLIHDYEGVDIKRVWFTVQSSIPELLNLIQPLLNTEDNQ